MTFVHLLGWPVAECACSARAQVAVLAFRSIDGTCCNDFSQDFHHHLSFIDPCIYLVHLRD